MEDEKLEKWYRKNLHRINQGRKSLSLPPIDKEKARQDWHNRNTADGKNKHAYNYTIFERVWLEVMGPDGTGGAVPASPLPATQSNGLSGGQDLTNPPEEHKNKGAQPEEETIVEPEDTPSPPTTATVSSQETSKSTRQISSKKRKSEDTKASQQKKEKKKSNSKDSSSKEKNKDPKPGKRSRSSGKKDEERKPKRVKRDSSTTTSQATSDKEKGKEHDDGSKKGPSKTSTNGVAKRDSKTPKPLTEGIPTTTSSPAPSPTTTPSSPPPQLGIKKDSPKKKTRSKKEATTDKAKKKRQKASPTPKSKKKRGRPPAVADSSSDEEKLSNELPDGVIIKQVLRYRANYQGGVYQCKLAGGSRKVWFHGRVIQNTQALKDFEKLQRK